MMCQALIMLPAMDFQTNVLIHANLVQCFENYYMFFTAHLPFLLVLQMSSIAYMLLFYCTCRQI